MLLLQADFVKKYFGQRLLLDFDHFTVYSGEKIGIVGANGQGKTTLLNLLAGEMVPDEGTIQRFCGLSFFHQLDFSPEEREGETLLKKEFSVRDKDAGSFMSGGELTRLKLASVLSQEVPLLFLDEPTCNLDYAGVELLKKKLQSYSGALLLISHDRDFLNSICQKIVEIDQGHLSFYEGNYEAYLLQAKQKRQRMEFEYEQYQKEKARLSQSIQGAKSRAAKVKKAPSRMGNSEARLHKRAAGEQQEKISGAAKALESRLEQLEVKEKPMEIEPIRMNFSLTAPPESKILMQAKNLNFSYGEKKIFYKASFEIKRGEHVGIVGKNGVGKTTLLQLILQRHPDIHLAPKLKIGYFAQDISSLSPERTILEETLYHAVQPESVVRTVLARLSFRREDVFKKIGQLSGGERIKVAIAALIVSSCNCLILDEPTNYLDVPSIEALQSVLEEYEGTLVFVSHDRQFVDGLAKRLLVVKDEKVLSFSGTLSAYENSLSQPAQIKKTNAAQEKLLLEMRLAELSARISSNPPNREQLEEEWQALAARKREMGL